jgi:hypothetical protein
MNNDLPARDYVRRAATVGHLLGDTAAPTGIQPKRLKGLCPDGGRCIIAVACSELCLRLEAAEIAAELRETARATRDAKAVL